MYKVLHISLEMFSRWIVSSSGGRQNICYKLAYVPLTFGVVSMSRLAVRTTESEEQFIQFVVCSLSLCIWLVKCVVMLRQRVGRMRIGNGPRLRTCLGPVSDARFSELGCTCAAFQLLAPWVPHYLHTPIAIIRNINMCRTLSVDRVKWYTFLSATFCR